MSIEHMKGLTFTAVEGAVSGSEMVTFRAQDGRSFVFHHVQDCCESVLVSEVIGDLGDLVGAPLVMAEESVSSDDDREGGHHTWTFYKFGTVKGYVTIRWLGTSNGYYSERVDLRENPPA